MDNTFNSAYSKIINISLLVTFIVSILLLILGFIIGQSYEISLSYFLGAITNIFGLTLIKKDINKRFNDDKEYSQWNLILGGNVFRFVFYGIVLFISAQKETLNVFIVAAGLLTVKVAIYIYSFTRKK